MTTTLRKALERLSAAALARDSTMGDPCALLAAKAELADANKAACAALAAPQPEPESTSAKCVYLVTWEQDKARCVEAFGDRPSAVAYANNISGALVTCVALRGMDYVCMAFGPPPIDGFGGNLDEAFERAPVVREPNFGSKRAIFQAGRDSYKTACQPMNTDDEAWDDYLSGIGGGGK